MSEIDIFKKLGTDPEAWAQEFARHFTLTSNEGERLIAENVMHSWFSILAYEVRVEAEVEAVEKLRSMVASIDEKMVQIEKLR